MEELLSDILVGFRRSGMLGKTKLMIDCGLSDVDSEW